MSKYLFILNEQAISEDEVVSGSSRSITLSLNGTRITDESLKHLLRLQKLTTLLLNDTSVSDEDTATLALLTRLEWLYLAAR